MILDPKRVIARPPRAERHRGGGPRRSNSGQRGQSLPDPLIEASHVGGAPIGRGGERHPEREHVGQVEAGPNRAQLPKGPGQETRPREQRERQGHLRDDQDLASALPVPATGGRSPPGSQQGGDAARLEAPDREQAAAEPNQHC